MNPLLCATVAFLWLGTVANAQSIGLTATSDSLNNKKVIIEVRNVEVNGKMVQDTVSIITYDELDESATLDESAGPVHGSSSTIIHSSANPPITLNGGSWSYTWDGDLAWLAVPSLALLLPILLLAVILYFYYKNRKTRYRLMEKAIDSGQPIAPELLRETQKLLDDEPLRELRTKGVSNVAVGLGLFILLWALTKSFALGCIGLLVVCIGAGKLVNYHLQMKDRQALRKKQGEQSEA